VAGAIIVNAFAEYKNGTGVDVTDIVYGATGAAIGATFVKITPVPEGITEPSFDTSLEVSDVAPYDWATDEVQPYDWAREEIPMPVGELPEIKPER
jgi:hypothetical protein